MERNMINGQSTAARNSANTSFMLSASTMFPFFGYKKMEITELNKNELVRIIACSIRECKSQAQFNLEFGDERYCIFLNKGDKGYYVIVHETSSKTVYRPVKEIIRHYFDCFRLTEKNIGNIANYVYDLVADYFYGVYEADAENIEVEISDAPMLEDAPSLEEDDITEEGYSVAGLEYLGENMPVVPVEAIVEGVRDYFSDCYVVARNRCMGFYECEFNEFCDIVWSYVWPIVCPMSDDALEAETRYYMEFDDRLRYMIDNGDLGALYIYNKSFVRSSHDHGNPDVVFAYDE